MCQKCGTDYPSQSGLSGHVHKHKEHDDVIECYDTSRRAIGGYRGHKERESQDGHDRKIIILSIIPSAQNAVTDYPFRAV